MQWHDWIEREVDGLDWAFRHRCGGQVPHERWGERPNTSPSIGWTLWHIARTHDFIVNAILRGEPQVWNDGWIGRLGLGTTEIGTGMSESELERFDASLVPQALEDYWQAVIAETKAWLPSLDLAALDERPPAERFEAAERWHAAGAEWLPEFWSQRTAEFLLRFPAIAHGYLHLGESQVVAALLGYEGD